MKSIIFLETNGVLLTQNGTDNALRSRGTIFASDGEEFFCPDSTDNLNKITDATDAEIVLISDWRLYMSLSEIKDIFKERGITGIIRDVTSKNETNPILGIKLWMKENGIPKSFIILDNIEEIEIIQEHFPPNKCIGTNFIKGLANKASYKRAISSLNKKDIISKIKQHKNLF